jgi:hypothetical protein
LLDGVQKRHMGCPNVNATARDSSERPASSWNSRLDQVLSFEHHTIRGKPKMEMRVTLALVVMLAMALGRIRIGQADNLRSLIAPIERAA